MLQLLAAPGANTSSVSPALWLVVDVCCTGDTLLKLATTDNPHTETFDAKVLVAQIDANDVKLWVFGRELNLSAVTFAFKALDRYLIFSTRDHALAVAHFVGARRGQ